MVGGITSGCCTVGITWGCCTVGITWCCCTVGTTWGCCTVGTIWGCCTIGITWGCCTAGITWSCVPTTSLLCWLFIIWRFLCLYLFKAKTAIDIPLDTTRITMQIIMGTVTAAATLIAPAMIYDNGIINVIWFYLQLWNHWNI